jgi:hypothetical protein
MPLSHADVTATVSVTGLALGCYNPMTQNYEVGLMRLGCHLLRIEVIKQLEDGSSSRLKFEIDDKHRIFIDTENGILPENPIYTDGDTFDRNDAGHDNEDFRWVVDFEKELNNNSEVILQRPTDRKTGEAIPVTEMYVEKPVLYADPELFVLDNFLLVDKADEQNPTAYGLFTEGIKADLKCQPSGSVVLRIDGPQGFEVHLPHCVGHTHQIKVDNTCPEDNNDGPTSTDFNQYYSVITETNGTEFDVQPEFPSGGEAGEGAVCNGSFLGVRGNLFPLPS